MAGFRSSCIVDIYTQTYANSARDSFNFDEGTRSEQDFRIFVSSKCIKHFARSTRVRYFSPLFFLDHLEEIRHDGNFEKNVTSRSAVQVCIGLDVISQALHVCIDC